MTPIARTTVGAASLAAALVAPSLAPAQTWAPVRIILTDRTYDTLWMVHDANGNGVIDEPDELVQFFGNANAAGTPTCLNPNALGVRNDGLVLAGDQDNARRCVYLLRDLNGDGDAMDAGESVIGVAPGNASGISFAFPTGVGFDARGRGFVVNGGNTLGLDGVYRLEDLDHDGTWSQAGEAAEYAGVPVFGAVNGPFVPYEICFVGNVGYMRDSGGTTGNITRGVYRLEDLNANGRADDPGEFTPFWTTAGQSGVAPAAGFGVCVDPMRPRSFYVLQTVAIPSAGTDQLIRLTDVNGDGDAQDSGEAELVYQTSESGFTSIAVRALPDGRVFVSDNSGTRIIVLRDLNGDGKFDGPAERSNFFVNTGARVGDCRVFAFWPVTCLADVATEGSSDLLSGPDGFITGTDFDVYVQAFFTEARRFCDARLIADVTDAPGTGPADGFVTGADFDRFIESFFSGC